MQLHHTGTLNEVITHRVTGKSDPVKEKDTVAVTREEHRSGRTSTSRA